MGRSTRASTNTPSGLEVISTGAILPCGGTDAESATESSAITGTSAGIGCNGSDDGVTETAASLGKTMATLFSVAPAFVYPITSSSGATPHRSLSAVTPGGTGGGTSSTGTLCPVIMLVFGSRLTT